MPETPRQMVDLSNCLQLVSQVVVEIPLLRRVEGEFQADQTLVCGSFEMIHRFRFERRIKTEQGFLAGGVADERSFVAGELGLSGERVVEQEPILEQDFVQHVRAVELEVERRFLLADVGAQKFDVFGFGLLRVGRELHARKHGPGEMENVESEAVGELSLRIGGQKRFGVLLLCTRANLRR